MTMPKYQYQSDFARKYFRQGEEQGEARGEANALRRTLLRLLSQKFPDVPDPARQRVEQADLEQLERWVERVFPAASLAEVFGDE